MNNSVDFYKIADTGVQTLLFVSFGYSLDKAGTEYHGIFLAIIGWQLVSILIHFFIKLPKILKTTQRVLCFIALLAYLPVFFYLSRHLHEKYFELVPRQISIPIYESVLTAIGLIIAFWYFVVGFLEVKKIFKISTN